MRGSTGQMDGQVGQELRAVGQSGPQGTGEREERDGGAMGEWDCHQLLRQARERVGHGALAIQEGKRIGGWVTECQGETGIQQWEEELEVEERL